MRPGLGFLLAIAVGGCSGLDAAEGGVVGIEVRSPAPDSLEIGESIQLSAKPLDKNGDSVATPVAWVSSDTTATIDAATGVLTGVSVGPARVQATVGSLSSTIVTFNVVPSIDTLAISGDSIFTASAAAGSTLPEFVTLLSSFNPAGPVPSHGVIYAITSPDPLVGPPAVVLATNDGLADTEVTASDGTARATLRVLVGATPPDSVVVEVRAEHIHGAPVAGSGQRFILRFEP